MARKGWGTGSWGNFKWGGEEDGGFTPVITGPTISLLPSTGIVKRFWSVAANLILSLLPTSDITRSLKTGVALSLTPSYENVIPSFNINQNGIELSLLPSYLATRKMATAGISVSLLPSGIVIANPSVGVGFLLTPSYEGLGQTNRVESNLALRLLPSNLALEVAYQVSANNLTLSLLPSSVVYSWACDKRDDSDFDCNAREESDWTKISRKTSSFTPIERETESWSYVPRSTTKFSEVAR